MSAQRARSTVAAENRSAHPDIPGVPWWGAILIATTATLAGIAIDAGSGHRELTFLFAALYVIGCVAAALAVRQPGIFTAVVQPPLVLFVAVPTAYYLFHRAEIQGVKDVLINCGYPLIERFLLMFTTTVVVLLIGMARWYFGAADRAGKAAPEASGAGVGAGVVAAVGAKVAALLNRRSAEDAEEDQPVAAEPVRRPRKHRIDRPAAAAKPPRERRSVTRDAQTRSRHARPPVDDPDGPPPGPRRRSAGRPRDVEDAPGPPPTRRRRRPPEAGTRTPKRDYRPRDRNPPEPRERPSRPSRHRSAYEPYGTYEPAPYDESPPPRPSTHHPFSNVRYRGSEEDEDSSRYRRPPPP